MHALLVQQEIDAKSPEKAIEFIREAHVEALSKEEGFVSGTWVRSRDGLETWNLRLYDSEDAARAALANAQPRDPIPWLPGLVEDAPIRTVSAKVFEVFATA